MGIAKTGSSVDCMCQGRFRGWSRSHLDSCLPRRWDIVIKGATKAFELADDQILGGIVAISA